MGRTVVTASDVERLAPGARTEGSPPKDPSPEGQWWRRAMDNDQSRDALLRSSHHPVLAPDHVMSVAAPAPPAAAVSAKTFAFGPQHGKDKR